MMLSGLLLILIVVMGALVISMQWQTTRLPHWIAMLAPIISSIVFIFYAPQVLNHQQIVETIQWFPALDINLILRLDGLGLFFCATDFTYGCGSIFLCDTLFISPT